MSMFTSDNLKRFAEQAKAGAVSAYEKSRSAAVQAGRMASEATEAAVKSAQAAARDFVGGSPALALIGQQVVVLKKTLLIESLLAEGGFASVYLASIVPPPNPDGTPAPPSAQKFVLKKMFAGGPENMKQLNTEVTLMAKLNHPNIVKLHASETKAHGRDGAELYVVMEYCPGGHLLARLNKLAESGASLPFPKLCDVMLQLTRPVAYLHSLSPPVAHRDIKFENILIAQDGTLKLCDFGSTSTFSGIITDKDERAAQEDAITRFTTPHFRAPEMVDLYSGLPLDVRVDVWALGCMLYGLAYHKHPFQETGPLAILAARYKIPYNPSYPPPLYTLLNQTLQIKPQDRPSAQQIVDYLEAVLKCPPTGPWPALQLSGGGSVPTVSMPAPVMAPDSSTPPAFLEMNAASGLGGGKGGSSSTTGGALPVGAVVAGGVVIGGGTTKKPQMVTGPTAAEIAAKIQASAPAAAAPSSSLAARLAKRGVAVPAGSTVPSAGGIRAPAPAPASQNEDLFGLAQSSSTPASRPESPVQAPAARRPSGAASANDLDLFGSASAPAPVASSHGLDFFGSAPAPASAPARRPSGDTDMFGLHAPSTTTAPSVSSDAFSALSLGGQQTGSASAPHKSSASSGLDDLFSSPPSSSPASNLSANLGSLYGPPSGSTPTSGVYGSAMPGGYGFPQGHHGAPAGYPGTAPPGYNPYGAPGGMPPRGPATFAPAYPPAGGYPPIGGYQAPTPAPAPAASGKKDPFSDLFSM